MARPFPDHGTGSFRLVHVSNVTQAERAQALSSALAEQVLDSLPVDERELLVSCAPVALSAVHGELAVRAALRSGGLLLLGPYGGSPRAIPRRRRPSEPDQHGSPDLPRQNEPARDFRRLG